MTKIQFSPYNKEGRKRKEDDKHFILKREMYMQHLFIVLIFSTWASEKSYKYYSIQYYHYLIGTLVLLLSDLMQQSSAGTLPTSISVMKDFQKYHL